MPAGFRAVEEGVSPDLTPEGSGFGDKGSADRVFVEQTCRGRFGRRRLLPAVLEGGEGTAGDALHQAHYDRAGDGNDDDREQQLEDGAEHGGNLLFLVYWGCLERASRGRLHRVMVWGDHDCAKERKPLSSIYLDWFFGGG